MAQGPIGSNAVRLCIDDSANRLPEACRVVLEGPYDPALTPDPAEAAEPNTLVEIVNARNIDALFGAGTVLAESIKVAMDCCRGAQIEFYALPREDAGTKAEYTLTVTAPDDGATSRGRMDIYWGEGRYITSVSVYEGETAEEIADKIAEATPDDFFFTATAAGGVVTLVAKNGGSYGNDVFIDLNWHGRDDAWPGGVDVAVEQTVAGAGAYPKYEDYEDLVGTCCACCWAVLTDDPQFQDGALEYIAQTWDCDRPMCATMGYTYNSGTVGQILAADTNELHTARLAHCNPDPADPSVGDAIFPWLKTAAYTAKSCCSASSNPELSIEGRDYGALTCVQGPGTCFDCFNWDDKEELREGGFVTTSPITGGDGHLTSPFIDNDISNGTRDSEGRLNRTWMDMNSSRLARETMKRLQEELLQYQGLALFTRNTAIREGVRGTSPKIILGKLRAWAKANVGILFSEFENLDEQLTVMQENETMPACYGDPRRLLVHLEYVPPLRIKDIRVTLRPRFDPLCGD